MADEPQQTPPSNNSRITAMLQDLAAQRAAGAVPAPARPQTPPPARPQTPAATAPVGTPPANLPVPPPQRPAAPAAPAPVARPVAPVPAAPKTPAIAPIPEPVTPPPAPKEPPVAPMPSVPRPPAPSPEPPKMPVTPPVAPPVAPITPPKAPSSIPQEGYSAELRTMSADIGNIKVGQAPSGIRQATPAAPAVPSVPNAPIPTPPAPIAPTIVVPSTSSGSSRKFIYWGIGAVVLIGITYALVLMIGGSGSTPTPTPTTSESSSPAPTLGGKTLRSYFGVTKGTIALPASASASDFADKILDIQPQGGLASPVIVTLGGNDNGALGALRILSKPVADALSANVGADQMTLLYGQKEHFTSTGAADTTQPVGIAAVFVFEVKDASAATQMLGTLATLDPRSDCTGFNSATYRQIPVQYRNCPFADNSEDYAIVLAGNQKNYLVISESRESMFFAIDQLMQ